MKCRILILALVFGFSSFLQAQEAVEPKKEEIKSEKKEETKTEKKEEPKQESSIYDIPRLDAVVIDGKDEDWGDKGFRIDMLVNQSGIPSSFASFNGKVRLGWNEQGLLILTDVTDRGFVEDDGKASLWRGDSIEFFFGTGKGEEDWIHVSVSPGVSSRYTSPRFDVDDHRQKEALKSVKVTPKIGRTKTADGYKMEVLLAWDALGIEPKEGREACFQIHINNQVNDEHHEKNGPMMWFPSPTQDDYVPKSAMISPSKKTESIRLALEPSPAVRAAAYIGHERFRRIVVTVLGTAEMVGKSFSVKRGEHSFEGVLKSDGAGYPVGEVLLPIPESDDDKTLIQVSVDGRFLMEKGIYNLAKLRKETIADERFVFNPSIFAEEAFPSGDFRNPSLMEDAMGRYTIKTKFYDENYNPVEWAAKPGRYGAVVEYTGAHGETGKRFVTLYRCPKGLERTDWSNFKIRGTVEIPREWGDAPLSAAAFTPYLFNSRDLSSGLAVYFASLKDMSLGEKPGIVAGMKSLVLKKEGVEKGGTLRTSPWGYDERWWAGLRKKIGEKNYFHYDATPEDYAKDENKKWPLIIQLHGSGGKDSSEEGHVKKTAKSVLAVAAKKDFIFVAPLCPLGERWSPSLVINTLDEVTAKYRVDPDRIYLTGCSMGGYGTWATATWYPERFAAIAPICGAGDVEDMEQLKSMPMWVFHGTKDPAVLFRESQKLVNVLKPINPDVKFTVYEGAGHGVWNKAWAEPGFCEWLLEHKKDK